MNVSILNDLSDACNKASDSSWKLHYKFRKYDICITVPLIVFSGLTSISATAQLINNNIAITILTIISAIMVTILTSLKQYLNFDNRCIIAKHVAKRWGSVQGLITHSMMVIPYTDENINNDAIHFVINVIFKEVDTVGGITEDRDFGSKEDIKNIQEITKNIANIRRGTI